MDGRLHLAPRAALSVVAPRTSSSSSNNNMADGMGPILRGETDDRSERPSDGCSGASSDALARCDKMTLCVLCARADSMLCLLWCRHLSAPYLFPKHSFQSAISALSQPSPNGGSEQLAPLMAWHGLQEQLKVQKDIATLSPEGVFAVLVAADHIQGGSILKDLYSAIPPIVGEAACDADAALELLDSELELLACMYPQEADLTVRRQLVAETGALFVTVSVALSWPLSWLPLLAAEKNTRGAQEAGEEDEDGEGQDGDGPPGLFLDLFVAAPFSSSPMLLTYPVSCPAVPFFRVAGRRQAAALPARPHAAVLAANRDMWAKSRELCGQSSLYQLISDASAVLESAYESLSASPGSSIPVVGEHRQAAAELTPSQPPEEEQGTCSEEEDDTPPTAAPADSSSSVSARPVSSHIRKTEDALAATHPFWRRRAVGPTTQPRSSSRAEEVPGGGKKPIADAFVNRRSLPAWRAREEFIQLISRYPVRQLYLYNSLSLSHTHTLLLNGFYYVMYFACVGVHRHWRNWVSLLIR